MKNKKIEHIRDLANNPPVKQYDQKMLKKAIFILLDHYDTGELMEFKTHIETLLNQSKNEKPKD